MSMLAQECAAMASAMLDDELVAAWLRRSSRKLTPLQRAVRAEMERRGLAPSVDRLEQDRGGAPGPSDTGRLSY